MAALARNTSFRPRFMLDPDGGYRPEYREAADLERQVPATRSGPPRAGRPADRDPRPRVRTLPARMHARTPSLRRRAPLLRRTTGALPARR